nr:hypothetical protein CFP56_66731 [Quercus suber]
MWLDVLDRWIGGLISGFTADGGVQCRGGGVGLLGFSFFVGGCWVSFFGDGFTGGGGVQCHGGGVGLLGFSFFVGVAGFPFLF